MLYKKSDNSFPRVICSVFICTCLAVAFMTDALAGATIPDNTKDARQLYQKAIKALASNKSDQYFQLKSHLTTYPLYPYLEAEELERNFDNLTQHHIDLYTKQYTDIPTVYLLQLKWLDYLASHKRWKHYLAAYKSYPVKREKFQCHYRNSLLQTGRSTLALKDIETLWNSGHSISDACDQVFNTWITKHRGPTSDQAYTRFWKAVDSNNPSLAKYLKRFITDKQQKLATDRYFQVRKNPALVKDPGNLPGDTVARQKIYLYGIDRLSRKTPKAASQLWFQIRTKLAFSTEKQQKLNRTLARRVANIPDKQTDQLLSQLNTPYDEKIQKKRINLALTALNWKKVHRLINEMPSESQQDERWVYWKTLSASHIEGLKPAYSDAFVQLSKARSYYGLLAARTLQTGFRLNPQQDRVSEENLTKLANHPSMIRMHELYQLDERYLARREWNQLTRDYDATQLRTAATILHRWGWHNMAIIGVAKAKYWDDISLRFPMPYTDIFSELAGQYRIDTNWARAIARQESAYQPHARSHVGARGLMQLMPKTAKMTAKRNKISYKNTSDLYQPQTNINLGVAYLAEMQKKFENNQVYATAAYNAGPHRVKRWLKQRGDLPVDIWIETIPFKETRRYVMNVMAYHAVYRTLAGQPAHILEGQTAFKVALQSSTGATQAEHLRDFIRSNNNTTQPQ